MFKGISCNIISIFLPYFLPLADSPMTSPVLPQIPINCVGSRIQCPGRRSPSTLCRCQPTTFPLKIIIIKLLPSELKGLCTICGAGSPQERQGLAIHMFALNAPMRGRAMYNSDGDMLIGLWMTLLNYFSKTQKHF